MPFALQDLQLMLLPSIDWCIKSWLIKTDLAVTQLAWTANDPRPRLLINVIQETFAMVPWCETDQVIRAKALEPLSRQPQQSPEVPGQHPVCLNPYCSTMIQLSDPAYLKSYCSTMIQLLDPATATVLGATRPTVPRPGCPRSVLRAKRDLTRGFQENCQSHTERLKHETDSDRRMAIVRCRFAAWMLAPKRCLHSSLRYRW
jgi:hypothetical protein